MDDYDILKDKDILAVDDEPDVLEVIEEKLFDSHITGVTSFEEARHLIESKSFDLLILDIMGVDGFDLLKLCFARKMPAVMLTGVAIDIASINRAMKLGAVSFLPKDALGSLRELTAEILEGLEQGQSHWEKLFKRLGPLLKEKFGILWEDLERRTRPRTPWS